MLFDVLCFGDGDPVEAESPCKDGDGEREIFRETRSKTFCISPTGWPVAILKLTHHMRERQWA